MSKKHFLNHMLDKAKEKIDTIFGIKWKRLEIVKFYNRYDP
jgi:hypothetical protein